MKKSFKQGDTVEIKKKYHNKVCISPETKMLIKGFCVGNNVITIWVDKSHTPYMATFFDFMLKKSKHPIPE